MTVFKFTGQWIIAKVSVLAGRTGCTRTVCLGMGELARVCHMVVEQVN